LDVATAENREFVAILAIATGPERDPGLNQ